MDFLGDIGKTLGGVAGATLDPFNISGMGGIPGVNSGDGGVFGKGGLLGDLTGSNARDSAIAAQTAGANAAIGTLRPYAEGGYAGLQGLQNKNLLGDYTGDPGYQFRLSEGNKAINNAASARGLGNSGATMKALTRYGQDYATNEYGNAYNREFNRLSTLAGIGNNAAGNIAGVQTGLGNANASANIAQSNQMSNLLGTGLTAGAMFFSDERLKTDIKELDAIEVQEFKSHLKPYLFKYLSPEHGEGTWAGVMAQDLEKSKLGRTIVTENEKGEKQIDLKKAVSLLLALEAGGY